MSWNFLARLVVRPNGYSTVVLLFFALNLFDLYPQEASATNNVAQNSSDAVLENGSPTEASSPATSNAKTVDDLFRNYSTNLSRLKAAYDLIGDANESTLIDLFEQVINRTYPLEDVSSKTELISLISVQLARENLEKAVSLYESQSFDVAKHMLYGVMHAWASKDFDGAVKFARKQETSIHSVAMRGIVDASMSLSEATLLDLGTEFGDVAYVERALAARQLEIDLANPDKTWASLINDATIYREENFNRIKSVANAMIDKYGAGEVDDLLSSIKSPALSFGLKKSILSNLSLSDPETAFNVALDTPNDALGTMLTIVITTWATTDPQSALARVRSLEPSRVRDRLEQKVVSSWVQLDPERFVDSFDDIPIELHDTARLGLIGQLSRESIEDALMILPNIQDIITSEKAALTIVEFWLDNDPDEAFEWILSDPEAERHRNGLLISFLEKLSDKNADSAFSLALSQPISDESGIGLEAIVIESISLAETDLAMHLLKRVRSGDTQLAAFDSVAQGLVLDRRTEEAIKLGESLSDKQQVNYYNNIAGFIAFIEAPKRTLELISDLPVEEARSKMAEHALRFHAFSDNKDLYSDDEVETLLQHVAPAELPQLRRLLQ